MNAKKKKAGESVLISDEVEVTLKKSNMRKRTLLNFQVKLTICKLKI